MNFALDELRRRIEEREQEARLGCDNIIFAEPEWAAIKTRLDWLEQRNGELERANTWNAEQIAKWETASGLETTSGDPEGVKPEHAQRYREELERRIGVLENRCLGLVISSKTLSEFPWSGIPSQEMDAAQVARINSSLEAIRVHIKLCEEALAVQEAPKNETA